MIGGEIERVGKCANKGEIKLCRIQKERKMRGSLRDNANL